MNSTAMFALEQEVGQMLAGKEAYQQQHHRCKEEQQLHSCSKGTALKEYSAQILL